MPYVPTWKERIEDAKPYLGPAIAVLVVLALAGWLAWHELWPREQAALAARPPREEVARQAAQRRLSGEVDVLEKTYRRALEAGEDTTAASRLLDRVIARQRERIQLEPAGNAVESKRLARLEAERASLRSRVAAARSVVLEREAQAAQAAGLAGEAQDKLREALQLQREANANAASEDLKDFQRETRLAQIIEESEIGPAHAAVETALTLARAALTREQRGEALKAFTEARARQAELNQRHPETRYADMTLLDQIDGEIESIKAAELVEVSAAKEHEADAAGTTGKVPEAAAAYAAAAAVQREVNERFPRGRSVSTARAEELETKRQTVLSTAPLARATALDREIAALLRRRQNASAAEKITAAATLVEKAATEFPRSRALDGALQRRLAYLALRTADLEALQELVLSRLAPVPGAKSLSMLKTEVSQDLYARVMNTNPSRNPGRTLPVDSVSWLDAREFCERLGWLLGCPTRLPTEAEFRAVYGDGATAWSAETSGGRSHEAGRSPQGSATFENLAGNLAEWLQPATEAGGSAPVAGGSYLDGGDALRRLPITLVEKRERARHIGFRVVVELTPE